MQAGINVVDEEITALREQLAELEAHSLGDAGKRIAKETEELNRRAERNQEQCAKELESFVDVFHQFVEMKRRPLRFLVLNHSIAKQDVFDHCLKYLHDGNTVRLAPGLFSNFIKSPKKNRFDFDLIQKKE